MRIFYILCLALCVCVTPAHAAKKKKKPPVGPPSPIAREIFGKQTVPTPVAAQSIGGYAKGCLAGARALPIDGPAWQAMRLSRNRNWGHPVLVAYLEKLATDAKKNDGWPGLLVGDMAQPRGGPMVTGHASHQIGLDADIWLTPMPKDTLTPNERETRTAISVLAPDGQSVDKSIWTPEHAKLIKRAASYPEVARIFVHPAIKKALCDWAGTDRGWLSRVRPWWAHYDHFHVRLTCPQGSTGCVNQPEPKADDGCGAELTRWLKRVRKPVEITPKPAVPAKPKHLLRVADLPAACAALVKPDLVKAAAVAVPSPPGDPVATVPMPEQAPHPEKKSAEKH
jgi:penicillin-insensitive murein DD-endopeptidase